MEILAIEKMNVLITNDDGIHAEGLLELKKSIEKDAKVFVVAPDRPRSACGHSITLHKPLRMERVKLADGSSALACSGTPTDCVSLGLLGVVEAKIDMVVSGINKGPNLGWDLTYSGTVSAAMEAVAYGVPSIAISVAGYDECIDYSYAAHVARKFMLQSAARPLPPSTLLNINIPCLPADKIKGIEFTKQGVRVYEGGYQKRTDPFGREYYWLGGEPPVDHLEEGTDVYAVHSGRVSVTPIHLDLTDYDSLEMLRNWHAEVAKIGSL